MRVIKINNTVCVYHAVVILYNAAFDIMMDIYFPRVNFTDHVNILLPLPCNTFHCVSHALT